MEDLGLRCIPHTHARDKIDGTLCFRVVRKPKFKIILGCEEECVIEQKESSLGEKKIQKIPCSRGTFLFFHGNNI
jgi:hypothetical protein